jgi:hypothetical protein
MSINRILVIVAVGFFVIAAISAYSSEINVNETGFLALGLASWAAAQVVAIPTRSFIRR